MPTGYQILKQDASYFLTMQVVEWVDIFSRKRYRDILCDSLNFCSEKKGLQIFSYVIMSNHCHMLARAANGNLSNVIRDLKKHTCNRIIESVINEPESRREWMLDLFQKAASKHKRNEHYQFWTHENNAQEIYSQDFTLQKIIYIHNNPVRAGLVNRPEEYIYSSAKNYVGEIGIVKVFPIDLHMLMSGKDSWRIKY